VCELRREQSKLLNSIGSQRELSSSRRTGRSRWIVAGARAKTPEVRVICFSSAGGSAFQYRQWDHHASERSEFLGVQIPGHDERLREPLLRRADEIVEEIGPSLLEFANRPFVLFGHSLGSLLAFEFARWARRQGAPAPRRLIVASRPSPQSPAEYEPVHDLPEPDLIKILRHFGGTTDNILEDAQLMRSFIPIIRADLEANRTYSYRHEPPFEFPITAIVGSSDPVTTRPEIMAWGAHTCGAFNLITMPGGHFFFRDGVAPLISILEQEALS
jgi:medium-chain acyl-[acyl-carrier-protein] hydrolase